MTVAEIEWGFRFLVDREPTQSELEQLLANGFTWRQLRSQLLASHEFAQNQKVIGRTPQWVITEILRGQYLLWIDLSDKYVCFGCLIDNYEPRETAVFRRLLKPGFKVADVGANVGWFTFVASSEIGPLGRVIAIEPRSPTASYLKRSVLINNMEDKIALIQAAVGSKSENGYLSWHPRSHNPGSTHLSSGINEDQASEVQSTTILPLDTLLQDFAVDCIKMDIEGAEGLALLGASRVIGEHRPVILCELNPAALNNVSAMSCDDFLQLARSRGYVVNSIQVDLSLQPVPGSVDFGGQEIANVVLFHVDRPMDIAAN